MGKKVKSWPRYIACFPFRIICWVPLCCTGCCILCCSGEEKAKEYCDDCDEFFGQYPDA